MTPDQEANMRSQLADYSKQEFIELAIQLQDVIDNHVREKQGLQASIDALGSRLPALEAKIQEYEDGGGQQQADPELEQNFIELRQKYEELRERFDRVQALNEKFQEKLLDAV